VSNGIQPLDTPLIEQLDILGLQALVTPLIEQLDILGFQPPVTPLVEQQPLLGILLLKGLLLKGHILLLKGHIQLLNGHIQLLNGHIQLLNSHIQLLNGQTLQHLLKAAQMIGSTEATLDATSSLMIFLSTGSTQRLRVKGKADT